LISLSKTFKREKIQQGKELKITRVTRKPTLQENTISYTESAGKIELEFGESKVATLKLGSKKDIKNFFKILAEESVKEAKSKIFDTSADAENLMAQSAADKQAFKTIVEEEKEEEIIDDEDAPEEFEAPESTEPATPDPASSASIEDVSLDAIQKKIMMMRSAPSVKDSSVEQRLSDYLKFLSKEEKVALLAYVEALSGLMTGEVPAESAPDPSDPPYNVQMNPTGGSEGAAPEQDEEEVEDEPVEAEAEVEEEEVEVEDDGNVPIQVGSVQESASIEKIRNKVIELLKRS
jgi:hypothetical protein